MHHAVLAYPRYLQYLALQITSWQLWVLSHQLFLTHQCQTDRMPLWNQKKRVLFPFFELKDQFGLFFILRVLFQAAVEYPYLDLLMLCVSITSREFRGLFYISSCAANHVSMPSFCMDPYLISCFCSSVSPVLAFFSRRAAIVFL